MTALAAEDLQLLPSASPSLKRWRGKYREVAKGRGRVSLEAERGNESNNNDLSLRFTPP